MILPLGARVRIRVSEAGRTVEYVVHRRAGVEGGYVRHALQALDGPLKVDLDLRDDPANPTIYPQQEEHGPCDR